MSTASSCRRSRLPGEPAANALPAVVEDRLERRRAVEPPDSPCRASVRARPSSRPCTRSVAGRRAPARDAAPRAPSYTAAPCRSSGCRAPTQHRPCRAPSAPIRTRRGRRAAPPRARPSTSTGAATAQNRRDLPARGAPRRSPARASLAGRRLCALDLATALIAPVRPAQPPDPGAEVPVLLRQTGCEVGKEGGRHDQHSGRRRGATATPRAGTVGHEARGGRHPRLGRRPREGVLRGASGGGSTPTSRSTTASGSSSSRRPARGARSSSARTSRRPRPARPRASTWSSPTSQAARDELVARGVDVERGVPRRTPGAQFQPDGADGRVSGPGPTTAATHRSQPSATRTATSGCCRRSRPGCPGGSTRRRQRTPPLADLANALRRAAAAHGEHEKRTGECETRDWPELVRRVHGRGAGRRRAARREPTTTSSSSAGARRASTAPARWPRAVCASPSSSASSSVASAPTGRASRPRRCCAPARPCTPPRGGGDRGGRRRGGARLARLHGLELLRRRGRSAGSPNHGIDLLRGTGSSPGRAWSRSTACGTRPSTSSWRPAPIPSCRRSPASESSKASGRTAR